MSTDRFPDFIPDAALLSACLKSRRLVQVTPCQAGFRFSTVPWPETGDATPEERIWMGKLSNPKLGTIIGADASRCSFLAALCWSVGEGLDAAGLRWLLSRMGRNLGISGGLANNPFLALAWTLPESLLPSLVNGILRYGRPRVVGHSWGIKRVGLFRATWADNLSTAFTSMLEGIQAEYINHPENILPAAKAIERLSGPCCLEARGIRFGRVLVEHAEWSQFKAAEISQASVSNTMPITSSTRFYSLRHQLAKTLVVGLHRCSRENLPPGQARTIREDTMRLLAAMMEKDPSDKETFLAALYHYSGFIPGIERFMGCASREMAEDPEAVLQRIRAQNAVSLSAVPPADPSDFEPTL